MEPRGEGLLHEHCLPPGSPLLSRWVSGRTGSAWGDATVPLVSG